jgi:hypothetical protein
MADQDRMEIYFHDLKDFPLSIVLDAMEWSRRNIKFFPMISDLRLHIEGTPDDHANQAWAALASLIRVVEPDCTVIIEDPVMAKVMHQMWHGSWIYGIKEFRKLEGDFARNEVKKVFLISYLEHYKHRDQYGKEPTVVEGQPKRLSPYDSATLKTYAVRDYQVTFLGTETLPPLEPRPLPMPPEERDKWENFFDNLDKKRAERDAQHSTVPGRQSGLTPLMRDLRLPGRPAGLPESPVGGEDETCKILARGRHVLRRLALR